MIWEEKDFLWHLLKGETLAQEVADMSIDLKRMEAVYLIMYYREPESI
ncbi:MAG: hypothetical protein ACLT33_01785 [Lachnospira pectinoschiza]